MTAPAVIENTLPKTIKAVQEKLCSELAAANSKFLEHTAEIDQVVNLLSDAQSQQNYIQELAYWSVKNYFPQLAPHFSGYSNQQFQKDLTIANQMVKQNKIPLLKMPNDANTSGRDIGLVSIFVANAYCYEDIFKVEPGEVFIDCGAYLGDSAIWAYQQGAARVCAFEPCPTITELLKVNLTDHNCPADDIYPYAVSDTNNSTTFFFDENCVVGGQLLPDINPEQVKIQPNAEPNKVLRCEKVNCIRLDDWYKAHQIQPTYIKMDIEGGENAALHGAAEIIQTFKPKLAICLYHKIEDMWEIPLYIHSLVPEYKFYCKKSFIHGDFILYAKV